MNRKKLLQQLQRGSLRNKKYSDIINLAEGFGFIHDRTCGSHNIFLHPHIDEPLNLQSEKGEAKPYQIRQLLDLVKRYNLKLEE